MKGAVVAAAAVIAALGLGISAVSLFPDRTSVGSGAIPIPRIANLWARDVSCTLATGVCGFNIENNNTVPLQLVGCGIEVRLSPTGTVTYPNMVWGTFGGPAVRIIPARSVAAATCSIPTSDLTLESEGLAAMGVFIVRLGGDLPGVAGVQDSYPAGTEFSIGFYGDWSASSPAQGGGAIPEFPYQSAALGVIILVISASYLAFRRRSGQREPSPPPPHLN